VSRGSRGAALLVAALLAAGHASGECAHPALSVEASARKAKQGGILALTLQSSRRLSQARLFEGDREIAMESDGGGTLFRALVGIDFQSAVGPRRLRVETLDPCGELQRSVEIRVVSGRFATRKLKVAPGYVDVPPNEVERVEEDRARVGRVWAAAETPRRWAGPFGLPVQATARDNFGSRRIYNGKPRSSHDGVDLSAASGATVRAPAPAVVALAGDLYFSGGTIILDHGGGLYTTYFHLSRIDVAEGDNVASGQTIGAVGATGRATGPHLHWGARLHRSRVNPLDLLQLPGWPLPEEPAGRGKDPTGQSD
jgi:murein DD-endopeptidase MepM/ murein hydrolase activator NlpD